ncbi:phospho-sugar mutase [Intestinimonas butyriciproducens]|uniref:phospho-sugar mutase n=1 Tax=Intestinimonas butyriciproducens TaxID=1297617 RepID=UPI0019586CAF|nr:phospho-sugar mutase [Intestinimonas butyriciproducens]MBM6917151.1 phospho-sugar mutase [Intestinimonas butyriciproducens]
MENWKIILERWLQSPFLSQDEKNILFNTSSASLRPLFQSPLSFGTAGLRGIAALGPGGVNRFTITQAALAFGRFLLSSQGERARQKGICLCRDCRLSSPGLAQAAQQAFTSLGIPVHFFIDPRPTPELSFAVIHTGAAGGMNITSSHNTKEYNGCKLYSHTGAQLTDEECAAVSQEMARTCLPCALPEGDPSLVIPLGEETDKAYLDALVQDVPPVSLPEDRARLRIVYTPLHGVGGLLLPRLLKEQGFTDVHCVSSQMTPDGSFPTAPSPNPENPETFHLALEEARRVGAHLIIATDPDADRVAFQVLHQGEYHSLSGHQSGSLLTDFLLSARSDQTLSSPSPLVIKSIVTTKLASDIAQNHGASCIDTFTGFKHMAPLACQLEQEGKGRCVIAFEEAIGCMIGSHCRDKDGLAAALAFCHLAAGLLAKGQTPLDRLEQLFADFGWYLEDAFSLSFSGDDAQARMAQTMERLRQNPPHTLGTTPVSRWRDYQSGLCHCLTENETKPLSLRGADMVYYELANGAALAIRPSGTEPKIKCYLLAHSHGQTQAMEQLAMLRQAVPLLLNKGPAPA